jgi:hypothetical protein
MSKAAFLLYRKIILVACSLEGVGLQWLIELSSEKFCL